MLQAEKCSSAYRDCDGNNFHCNRAAVIILAEAETGDFHYLCEAHARFLFQEIRRTGARFTLRDVLYTVTTRSAQDFFKRFHSKRYERLIAGLNAIL